MMVQLLGTYEGCVDRVRVVKVEHAHDQLYSTIVSSHSQYISRGWHILFDILPVLE